MDTRGAKQVVGVAIVVLVVSVFSDLRGVSSVPLLAASLVLASLAMIGVVVVTDDPMRSGDAIVVVALGISGSVLAFVAVPHVPANANQTNAVAASVATFAFICARGRSLIAWAALAALLFVAGVWGFETGQGFLRGVLYAAPNVAVIGMATVFATIVRPAAADIGRLRQQAVNESAKIAATAAHREERQTQRQVLRELTYPTMAAVAAGVSFSEQEVAATELLALRLRDGIRAPALNVPTVIAAALAVRGRGIRLVLFDDGGLDEASADLRHRFCDFVALQLQHADSGTITVRVAPPGRPLVGSVVAITASGISRRADMDVSGRIRDE